MDSGTVRPRRSALYMPASNARALEKAHGLAADVVILDLEDAVAPGAKPAARLAACEAIGAGGFGRREVVIRVNGLASDWGAADIAAAAGAGPDAILVPKIDSAADVANYDERLAGAPARVRLWVMIETCAAMFELGAIARAARTTRLAAFVLGINDLAKEMRARQTPDRAQFLPFMAMSVAAARSEGLVVLDGVHNEIEDLEGLAGACRQAADLGFDGKTLIHPSHLDVCNRAFTPSAAEVAWAKAVVQAFGEPQNAGVGALRVEGRLAERLHLEQSRQLIALAEAIGAAAGG
ncbi:MAG TPA: CoA ester lyase [Caulobacteraceae bacterium]|nr:CoA ester lyase [Caulobacteraceae bacterium]